MKRADNFDTGRNKDDGEVPLVINPSKLSTRSIVRRLKGSYGHTSTGLAERHIELTRAIMLKCKSDAERDQALDLSDEDLAFEAGMAQNTMLEYGGFTPCQCVMGHNPRGYYEFEADTLEQQLGAVKSAPDVFEANLGRFPNRYL